MTNIYIAMLFMIYNCFWVASGYELSKMNKLIKHTKKMLSKLSHRLHKDLTNAKISSFLNQNKKIV